MFIDPDNMDAKTSKEMGLWPTPEMMSYGIIPYIKRIAKEPKVLIIGDLKGEDALTIAEAVPNVRMTSDNTYDGSETHENYKKLFRTNTASIKDKKIKLAEEYDVVIIEANACNSDTLSKYYPLVRPDGIFAGGGHDTTKVKEALNGWRRAMKIGTPIMVSERTVWFWYKRK